MRSVIKAIADTDSSSNCAPLRPRHGHGAAADEGRPFGVIANNPMHMAGAIEAEARTRPRAS